MTEFTSLLPPNAAPEMRQREATLARIEDIPSPIADLWQPARCPAALLPVLAWSLSVDHWDPHWPEATKRAIISAAYDVHAHKGTRHAVDAALAPLDIVVHVTEWFDQSPPGPPGTFTVEFRAEDNRSADNPLTIRTVRNALAMMRGAKRLSQHLEFKMSAMLTRGIGLGAGLGVGSSAMVGGETRLPVRVAAGGVAGQITFGASASIGVQT